MEILNGPEIGENRLFPIILLLVLGHMLVIFGHFWSFLVISGHFWAFLGIFLDRRVVARDGRACEAASKYRQVINRLRRLLVQQRREASPLG